ncbi:MAG: S9 family peptidase [Bryobacteraceae bacterium]|nr:S9 family peptidase [Bryobacteraceae bacterium]
MRRLVLVILAALPMLGGERLLTKETFFDFETISNPSISPDGTQIVFSRGWLDNVKDQNRANLWIVDREGKRVRELTHGNWRDSEPVWSPDGKRIAFLSDRDGTTQVHVMWLDTREVAQLTHLERTPADLAWSPSGKQLAFTMSVPDEDPILAIRFPKKPRGAQWAKEATVVDRLTWARDGVGPIPKGFTHIFVLDAELGGKPRQLTDGKFNHGDPQWSPDGSKIYMSGMRKPEAEYLRRDTEVYAIDMKTGSIAALTDRKGGDATPRPSPDGKWVAYTGFDDRRFTQHLSEIYVMDASGGGKRLWAGGLPSTPGEMMWAADSSGVYYLMQERGSAHLYFLPLQGEKRKVTDGVQMLAGLSMANNGQAAAVRSTPREPGSLVTFSAAKPAAVTKLVDVNADALEGVKLADVEEMWFSPKDGWKVQGWLVKPANWEPGKKYPMVLYIHGGPWSMYDVSFNWAWQNFAANGYAVLYTNPRGSTGYGQEFVNGIQYSYPGKDYDDLMAGVDAALAKGWIDERNLFVCGGSGGGVLTAWIVGHTNRFRAAVSMRPVINWHSFVGTTDGPSWYDQFQKFPWEDPAEYAARSPLTYVSKVTTPTMVMTGEADLRTPMGQSEEYYRALKMLKKETLLVRMPEEYHGWRRPSHRLAQQLYLLAWFEKHRVKDGKAAGAPDVRASED